MPGRTLPVHQALDAFHGVRVIPGTVYPSTPLRINCVPLVCSVEKPIQLTPFNELSMSVALDLLLLRPCPGPSGRASHQNLALAVVSAVWIVGSASDGAGRRPLRGAIPIYIAADLVERGSVCSNAWQDTACPSSIRRIPWCQSYSWYCVSFNSTENQLCTASLLCREAYPTYTLQRVVHERCFRPTAIETVSGSVRTSVASKSSTSSRIRRLDSRICIRRRWQATPTRRYSDLHCCRPRRAW